MPRDLRQTEREKRAKARRSHALKRVELREPSTPRIAPAGPTSPAVKATDPDVARMIAEFEARRRGIE